MLQKIILLDGNIFLMNDLEAILLAGGHGKRLHPFTFYTSKHLLPVDNIPMIFYPLKNLQLLGVKKVFLIVNEHHLDQYTLLISKYNFKMDINLVIQDNPLGIPDAILKCEDYIKGDKFIVALGDNLIVASNFINRCKEKFDQNITSICGFNVSDPRPFGVAKYKSSGDLLKVVEKPKDPPSNTAIVGFYQFTADAFSRIKKLEYSERGELEIADLINLYIDEESCQIIESESSTDYWIDTGTNESLINASNFIRDLKKNNGIEIGHFELK